MSRDIEKELPELLRKYFVEHADLPVAGGAFNLSDLLPDGESMALILPSGGTERTWIDGSRMKEQMLLIRYRSPLVNDNDIKSEMMGELNGIGIWMDEVMASGPPFFGESITTNRFELTARASPFERTEKSITYQAGYVLGYETK